MNLTEFFFAFFFFLCVCVWIDWKEILSKTSVMAGDQKFNDTCKACFSLKQKNRPAILGTSLTSLEPEPSIRLYMARGRCYTNCNLNLKWFLIFSGYITSKTVLEFYLSYYSQDLRVSSPLWSSINTLLAGVENVLQDLNPLVDDFLDFYHLCALQHIDSLTCSTQIR